MKDIQIQDNLIIGFDYTKNDDITVLMVMRKTEKFVEIVKCIQGDKAERLYKELTEIE